MMITLWSGNICIIYVDDKLSCCFSISLFLLLVLYVQQCSPFTDAAQCDVYKCNAKSKDGVDIKCPCAYIAQNLLEDMAQLQP